MQIAIQGETGSFSHEAALRFASELMLDSVHVQPCALSPEVFERLVTRQADAAVIPIENTLAGSVLEHYDLLLAHPVRIEAELLLRIRHHLIVAPGVPLSTVREVYSHPVALAQCRNFFAAHPALQALPFYDTAGSAAHAVSSGGAVAGIGSEHAASTYGGEVLLAGIEDHAANYTRFLLLRACTTAASIVSDSKAGPNIPDKVSLAFAVPNLSGSLVAALQTFARHGLNLTRLESRPVPGSPWQYVFYVDYQLANTESAGQAIAELTAKCSFVKELGRYRTASSLAAAEQ
jgi:prephenate dehydratase